VHKRPAHKIVHWVWLIQALADLRFHELGMGAAARPCRERHLRAAYSEWAPSTEWACASNLRIPRATQQLAHQQLMTQWYADALNPFAALEKVPSWR
jgi:hypothetical protein